MATKVYFKCQVMHATITTSCCEDRREKAGRASKQARASLSPEGQVYRICNKCIQGRDYERYQQATVPAEDIELIPDSAAHQRMDYMNAADTKHSINVSIHDRSYNPFREPRTLK